MTAPGIIISAPASGQGKTIVTLAIIRALTNYGLTVAAAKAGPDYIDPAFHAAAGGNPCFNIDPWAMRLETFVGATVRLGEESSMIVCEGAMGLFDGAADGRGSTADISATTGWPVVLVVDVRGQGASVAALLRGFAGHRRDLALAGVILNRVGSARHADILTGAIRDSGLDLPVLGCLPRDTALELPDRHLGLVQASEHPALDDFLEGAAEIVRKSIDLKALRKIARRAPAGRAELAPLAPIGQRTAIARDEAFAFSYASVLEGWRAAGAELSFFSPLADEAPAGAADAVYLPGGYPELQAGRLANNGRFLAGLRDAAARDAAVYGECGGYMVLGRGLTDADGVRHAMAGLLPLETSFAERKLHLGYRAVTATGDSPLGAKGLCYTGHEFHYATVVEEGPAEPLFTVADARGTDLGHAGLS
ncbi:MAG: cobyrinate a,c-diamide synthase, partial [Alphaproteobacteria bacterium]|nr:cobyrinate a,c-diamide synthase [Alphaproteobacteria bacterium]